MQTGQPIHETPEILKDNIQNIKALFCPNTNVFW